LFHQFFYFIYININYSIYITIFFYHFNLQLIFIYFSYYICKFEPCNLYIDANGQEVMYYQPEEGAVHDLEYVPEVPWTEEADGCREHWKCLVCEKLFADEAGTQRVWLSELLFGKPSTDVKPEEDNKDDVKEEASEDFKEQEKGNVPKTGDVSAIMLWAMAAVGAGSSILAVGKKKL
jgi:hypothetical protein